MPDFLIDAGLPMYPPGLSDDDANLVAPLYRAINAVAQQASSLTGSVQYNSNELSSLDPFTGLRAGALNRMIVTAGENLVYGHIVSLYVEDGNLMARRADAALGWPAHGAVEVPTGIPAGTQGLITFMNGRAGGIAGSALGVTYYLSTAGAVQSTPPNVDGVLNQVVGVGLDAGGLFLQIQPYARVMTDLRVLGASATGAVGTGFTGYSISLRMQFGDGFVKDVTASASWFPPDPGGS